jgi:hypothetical protein
MNNPDAKGAVVAVNMGKNVHKDIHKNMHKGYPRKKTWKELSPKARVGTIVGATVQLMLLFAAQRDISRRPAVEIRGTKAFWRVATLVNFIGPGTYFTFGVKRHLATK